MKFFFKSPHHKKSYYFYSNKCVNLRSIFLWTLSILFVVWLQTNRVNFKECLTKQTEQTNLKKFLPLANKDKVYFTNASKLIFIGGPLKSGSSLMQALLNSHPHIRCSEEKVLIKKVIQSQKTWTGTKRQMNLLNNAGIDQNIVDSAVGSFILELMIKQGDAARHLCNKDSFIFDYSTNLNTYFPQSKYILMVRDGRAVAHSVFSDRLQSNLIKSLTNWNSEMKKAYKMCQDLGAKKCFPVYYEKLILNPSEMMGRVLKFLDIENKFKFNELSISMDNLYAWFDEIPESILDKADTYAPMLAKLGYDPKDYRPKYNNMK